MDIAIYAIVIIKTSTSCLCESGLHERLCSFHVEGVNVKVAQRYYVRIGRSIAGS